MFIKQKQRKGEMELIRYNAKELGFLKGMLDSFQLVNLGMGTACTWILACRVGDIVPRGVISAIAAVVTYSVCVYLLVLDQGRLSAELFHGKVEPREMPFLRHLRQSKVSKGIKRAGKAIRAVAGHFKDIIHSATVAYGKVECRTALLIQTCNLLFGVVVVATCLFFNKTTNAIAKFGVVAALLVFAIVSSILSTLQNSDESRLEEVHVVNESGEIIEQYCVAADAEPATGSECQAEEKAKA